MQWNNDANDQDLVHVMNDWSGMDDNIWTLKAKCRDANMANREIWSWIHEAYGGWMYDDGNNTTDFPTATATLVADQKDYQLPSSALTVRGVEIQLNSNNVWTRLFPKTEEEIRDDIMAEGQFMRVSSQPRYYTAYGNSIRIYPPANYTKAGAIRVSYERETVAFTPTGNDTRTPGFAPQFHEAVGIGAVKNFSKYKTISQKNDVITEWADYKDRITKFYQSRWKQMFPTNMSVKDAVQESM